MANLHYSVHTSGALSNHAFAAWLVKTFLDRLEKKLHFAKFGMPAKLRKGQGKVIKWNRWANFSANTTALTEGETPDGLTMTSTNVSATVAQYGDYVTIPDLVQIVNVNDTMRDAVDLLGYRAGLSMDALVRNEVDANGTAQYTDGATDAAVQADSSKVLIASEIRKAVRTLRNADVDEWDDGLYRAIIHPTAEYDLLSETAAGSAIQTVQYTSNSPVEKGLIGSLYGVRFFRSTHVRAADSPNTNVYKHCIIGKNAYGTVDLEGMGLEMIVKPMGSGEDPINQRGTVGYKFAYVAKMLDANRVVVIHAYGV